MPESIPKNKIEAASAAGLAADAKRPTPRLNSARQPGIADPQWPQKRPRGVSKDEYPRYRGGIDRQSNLCLVGADIIATNSDELRDILRRVTRFSRDEMKRKPVHAKLALLSEVPSTYRVTITVALGWKIFLNRCGDDRFGLQRMMPRSFAPMPSFSGDDPGFVPDDYATDLLFVIASDHPYVNIAIARSIAHGWVDCKYASPRYASARLVARWIEQGFTRPDVREFLKFEDGTDNIRNNTKDRTLDRLTFVHSGDGQPDWCIDGSFLVYRKVRENLPRWERLNRPQKESAIGRHEKDGLPLSRFHDPRDIRQPRYPDPTDARDGPLTAHIRKVQPRREEPDFTGTPDLDRRFLRRPYPFFEGMNATGEVLVGLHFLGFMRNIHQQFEWAVRMWQTNPDFPKPGTGVDAMYSLGILTNVGGGYYFCPPAPSGGEDYLGSGMFD
jgi:deferrochelatase/peroxidase EfeB